MILWFNPRNSLDMDGTITLIFSNLLTTQDIVINFQHINKWIFTKFWGHVSKIKPTMPIWNFGRFWQKSKFWNLETSNFVKSGTCWAYFLSDNVKIGSEFISNFMISWVSGFKVCKNHVWVFRPYLETFLFNPIFAGFRCFPSFFSGHS